MSTKFSWFKITLLFLIALVLFVTFFNSLNRYFNHDELEAIHTAWKIHQGEIIYTDFFQHHHPLFYYLLIPIIKTFGENTSTLIASRIFVFLFFSLSLWITYLLAKKIFDTKIALLSVFLLASQYTFTSKALEVRPDLLQSIFAMVALLFLFHYFENKKTSTLLLSSLFLTISFLILQKSIFIILIIGAILLFELYRKKIAFSQFFIYPASFLFFLSPYFVYLLCNGSFENYFFFNWTLNSKFLNYFLPFEYLWENIWKNAFFWLFYFLGIIFFLKTASQKFLAFISLALLSLVFAVRSPFPQYYVLIIPYAAIIASSFVYSFFKDKNKIILSAVMISSILPIFFLMQDAQTSNKEQLKKINYVLSITDHNDYVYDGDIQFNVFRKDLDFFWFSLRPKKGGLETYKTLQPYNYDIYKKIETYNPPVISKIYLDKKNKIILENYKKSPVYEDLFLRNK